MPLLLPLKAIMFWGLYIITTCTISGVALTFLRGGQMPK